MSNVIAINTSKKKQSRLEKLVAEAKLTLPYPQARWDDFCWNIEGFGERRIHDKRALNLHFIRLRQDRNTLQEPFAQPFADFAKTIVATRAASRAVGYSFQKQMIDALRYLYEALLASGAIKPSQLVAKHFQIAILNVSKDREHRGAYALGTRLQEISEFVDEYRLAPASINFKNSISHPPASDGTDEHSQKKGLEKMPSPAALETLAMISNEPFDDNERILLRIVDLLVVGGFRIGEVLSLPLDCWIEETAYNKDGSSQSTVAGEKAPKRCGLRYIPEKGGEPVVKWLPDHSVPFARRAVEDLIGLCFDARGAAFLLEQNPDRVPLPGNFNADDLIDINQFVEISGLKIGAARRIVMYELKIKPYKNKKDTSDRKNLYRIGDIERALLTRRAPLEVVKLTSGRMQTLSDSLCVMFLHQFDYSKDTVRFLPQLIGYRQIRTALGGEEHAASFFSRRNLKEVDGSRMKIRTHAFRHWLNTMADQGGLSDIQLALWMGRRDAKQNAAYKHGTVSQRAQWAKEALQDGKLSGAVSDMYEQINDPVEKKLFLETFVNVAHFTDYGVCLHDYALDPCRYHLNCLSGCGEFARTKGDQEERRKIRELRVFTAQELEMAEKAVLREEYNANAWVEHNRTKLAGCDAALAIDDDESQFPADFPNETIKVYPESPSLGKPLVDSIL